MKLFIAIIGLLLMPDSVSAGSKAINSTEIQNVLLAQREVHSTAGIANQVERLDEVDDGNEIPADEAYPYSEEEAVQEELPPPVTEERISPTRGRIISRTVTRPSNNDPPPAGIGIAPIVAPVYGGDHGYPYPPRVYNPPRSMPR